MTEEKPKVFIACPSYGQMNFAQTTSSIVNTALMLHTNGLYGGFGNFSYPDIADARNIFLTLWYDRIKTSHLLFVDSDMAWPFEMVADMILANASLVGCIYPKKTLPCEFVGTLSMDQRNVPDGFKRALGVGGGVMLIRRDCVDKIMEHNPSVVDYNSGRHTAEYMLKKYNLDRLIEAFSKIKTKEEYVSEDISFCRRALAAGIDILANIRHRVTHVGPYEFTASFEESLKATELAVVA